MNESRAGTTLNRTELRALATAEAKALADRLTAFTETVLSGCAAEAEAKLAEAHEVLQQRTRQSEQLTVLVADLQHRVETLSAELDAERALAAEARLEAEKATYARLHAEEAWEHGEEARHRQAVAFERQLRDARADVDVGLAQIARLISERDREAAECARLATAFEAATSAGRATEEEWGRAESAPECTHAANQPPTRDAVTSDAAARVLQELEGLYAADVKSGTQPAVLVNHLAVNLEEARKTYARRVAAEGIHDTEAFDRQLFAIIDAPGATMFGRHLAVATYTTEQRATDSTLTALAS